MSGHVFKRLIHPEEARQILLDRLSQIDRVVETDVWGAVGRVLAEDVEAPIDLPPFTRSLRDGYAVRSIDIASARENNPVKLRLVGSVEAGGWPDREVGPGEAVRIATGAPIPPGADTVVMEEYTELEDGYVLVFHYSPPGEWIQNAGSDVSLGEGVLEEGTLLTPREIGILSGLGITRVKVYDGLKVAVISSGDEVIPPGEELGDGQIYDVNGHAISAALVRDGCKPRFIGVARDTPESMAGLLEEGLETSDVVVFSGATSVGVKDVLRDVIESIGDTEILFNGLRIKPGKPTLAALIRGKLFIGLPGFPVSSLMVYLHVFSPVIRWVNRLPTDTARRVSTTVGAAIDSVFGVEHLHPVILKDTGSGYMAYPIQTDSGAIATLRLADGYVVIPENQNYLEMGDRADAWLIGESRPSHIISFSSHSIVYDTLMRRLNSDRGVRSKRIYVGSTSALKNCAEGFSDMGVIHLLDEDGVYNIGYVERYGADRVVLHRGFMRRIGFVVAKGNPKGISGWRDLLREDVRFINRSVGSGIRVYTDMELGRLAREMGLEPGELRSRIFGYSVEARTHSAVVKAVEKGLYDVGVASEVAIQGRDVDFIPLRWEYVDIIFNAERYGRGEYDVVLEWLGSEEARRIIEGFPGVMLDKDYLRRLI